MLTCISSHGLKRSWRSCPRRVNAGNKNTPSTHHPRRWNVTTLMVGLKNGHIRKNLTQKWWTPEIQLGNAKKKNNKKPLYDRVWSRDQRINPHCKHHSGNCTAQAKNGNSSGLFIWEISTVPSYVSVVAQLQHPCCAWPSHFGDVRGMSVIAALWHLCCAWPSHFGDIHGVSVVAPLWHPCCAWPSHFGDIHGVSVVAPLWHPCCAWPSHFGDVHGVSAVAPLWHPCCAWPSHFGDVHGVSVVAPLWHPCCAWPSHFGDVHGVRV